ncbi:hypothetical protein N7468_009730 [Penicillium chermesinum]|uniref:Uncharacterized protein n=1 Tax=Penicillium chermesinum TaxID=63820 RepID=A0A9W9NIN5_9EURO|nr:uncharacterized protein N7468_009730 [Penicillium chermesinum]KAJ5220526.1 hypothetical protein N7468_009730 [Penicillium chermesinum]
MSDLFLRVARSDARWYTPSGRHAVTGSQGGSSTADIALHALRAIGFSPAISRLWRTVARWKDTSRQLD